MGQRIQGLAKVRVGDPRTCVHESRAASWCFIHRGVKESEARSRPAEGGCAGMKRLSTGLVELDFNYFYLKKGLPLIMCYILETSI